VGDQLWEMLWTVPTLQRLVGRGRINRRRTPNDFDSLSCNAQNFGHEGKVSTQTLTQKLPRTTTDYLKGGVERRCHKRQDKARFTRLI
jgi:hypothetical protein